MLKQLSWLTTLRLKLVCSHQVVECGFYNWNIFLKIADNSDEETAKGEGTEDTSDRNVNAEVVAKAEREQREKSRAQAAAKKEKDKEDREKQKKQAEDRKKKAQEKSAKGERKR